MLDLKLKQSVWEKANQVLRAKRQNLEHAISENRKALETETKSSAGDKHETGRAMLQLEQEKLGSHFVQLDKDQNTLKHLQPEQSHTAIKTGSLIKLSSGYFYLSVGLGALPVKGLSVYCLTPASPLGQALLGEKQGSKLSFRNATLVVEELI